MAGALGSLAQNLSFPGKLYELVGVAAEQGICRWTSTGFVIVNREQLCTKLLPLYFRHDRMDSFQRQLNMCVSRHMREVSQTVGDAIPHTRRPECSTRRGGRARRGALLACCARARVVALHEDLCRLGCRPHVVSREGSRRAFVAPWRGARHA